MKKCKKCGEDKSLDDFYKFSSYRDGMCKLCRNAYTQQWRQLKFSNEEYYRRKKLISEGKNYCRICGQEKPLELFIKSDRHRLGYESRCTPCRRLEYKTKRLKYDYGLTPQEYTQMYDSQEKVCAICKQPLELKANRTCVDHDHTTGEVRGLLCNNCNRVLGLLKDDPKVLYSAIKYLKIAHNKSDKLLENPEEDNQQPITNLNG